MNDKIWGVWKHDGNAGWCCLEHGDASSDEPYRSTKTRAEEVCKYLSRLFPSLKYEVKLYQKIKLVVPQVEQRK